MDAPAHSRPGTDAADPALSEPRVGSPVARLLRPVRWTLATACTLQALSSAVGVIPFIAVAELGRVLLADGSVDEARAWTIAWLGAGSLVVRLVLLMAAVGLTHLADVDFRLELRRRMAARLGRVPLGWFTDRTSGQVKKALQDDVSALHHLVAHGYVNLTSAIVTPIAALAYLLWVDWRLTLITIIPLFLGMIAHYAVQVRGTADKMKAYEKALANVNAASVAFVQGIAVIKTFGHSRKSYDRFIEEAQQFGIFFRSWAQSLMRSAAAAEVVLSPLFSLVVVLAAGVAFVSAGWAAPADVLPFAILGLAFTAPFLTLSYARHEMLLASRAAERISALLDTPVLPDRAAGRPQSGTRIVYEGVRFSYDDRTVVLRDVNLVLEPGTVTALVGPSGSGKTSLARLLPRFWDPTGGRITLGGLPLDAFSQGALYRQVGFVFQDVQLLRASVRDNIALGRPDASMAVIEVAAKAARIHERILALPRGYEAVVGEDARLSGGEAQRVSIARAILADAPILVLDEATAFADPISEAAIQDAISTLIAGRTLLVIAHRLHTIMNADQICVLDRGRIVERGHHSDLLNRGGLYARLWLAETGADGLIQPGREVTS